MTPRRELGIAVLMTLTGAGLLVLAAGRAWVRISAPSGGILAMATDARGQSAPLVRALGLAAFAGIAGIAAARGRGRVAVGLVIALAGAGAAAAAIFAVSSPRPVASQQVASQQVASVQQGLHSTGWPWVAALGGVIVALAGALVARRGRHWSALSQRYAGSATTSPTEVTDATLWDALSRGDDPTSKRAGPGS